MKKIKKNQNYPIKKKKKEREVAQSCLTLCDPMDCSLPGSSVHGIFQASVLEWVAISSSRDLPDPWMEPAFIASPALASRFFTTAPPGKPTLFITRYDYASSANNLKII